MRRPSESGWTLVESLIVVAVIGILVAIAIPALRGARHNADAASNLADLRTHASIIALYTADQNAAFPNFIDPRLGTGPLPGTSITDLAYFSQSSLWPFPLLNTYYNFDWPHEVFYLRSAEGDLDGGTIGHNPSYVYGATLLAFPSYWNQETRLDPPMQLGIVKSTQVRYSSNKSLFDVVVQDGWLDTNGTSARARVLAAFVDGSAASFSQSETEPGYFNGPGNTLPWSQGRAPGTQLAYTIDGVLGRDVKSR